MAEVYQLVRFGLVGFVATAVHIAAASMLLALSWPVWTANFLAFCAAFWVSFFGHRHFTFRSRGSSARFLVTALTGLAANNGLLAAALRTTSDETASIIFAAIAAPALVFVLSKYWAFR